MKLLKGSMSVLLDLDVVQGLTLDLRIAQPLSQNYAGKPMTSLVGPVKESVYLGFMQPLAITVQKATQLLQQLLAGKQTMKVIHSANESVVLDVVHDLVETGTGREEGESLPLICKLNQTEADSTAEVGSHVPIGPIVVNAEEEPAEISNEAENAAKTIDARE